MQHWVCWWRRRARNESASKPLSATSRCCRTVGRRGSTACRSCCGPGASQTATARPCRSATGRQLGVEPTLGAADRLRSLATRRIGPGLMQLDVRAVQVPQGALRPPGQALPQSRPQATGAPATPARVDRTPRSIALRHIAPGATRCAAPAKSPLPRSGQLWAGDRPKLPPARFRPRTGNIFSRCHSDSGNVHRSYVGMSAPATHRAIHSSTRFQYTPSRKLVSGVH